MSLAAYQHVCLQKAQGCIWGWPTLDVFAGGASVHLKQNDTRLQAMKM